MNTFSFDLNYYENPEIIINCERGKSVLVEFYEPDNRLIKSEAVKNHMNCSIERKYHSDFYIKLNNNGDVTVTRPDLQGKRVYIILDSTALGDTIAWFPQVEAFRLKHGCQVFCSTYHNYLFAANYPGIEFVEPGTIIFNLYKRIYIGWYYNDYGQIDTTKCPFNFRLQHLQKTASDILGLPFQEIRPRIDFTPTERPTVNKYFCIAVHSTKQAKYWNYPGGWQSIVNYLSAMGYEVYLLSKEPDGYNNNFNPQGVIKLDNKSLKEISNYIYHAEGFIGLGSGLSWLAWALHKKVGLISGFSRPYSEMSDCIRIYVPDESTICNGCFNDFILDRHDWNWCPRHQNTNRQFECTRSITPISVIAQLQRFF